MHNPYTRPIKGIEKGKEANICLRQKGIILCANTLKTHL